MTAAFDPELYLRLAGERAVLDSAPQQAPKLLPLAEMAGALAGVGAIDAELASRIVEDYHHALALRGYGLPMSLLQPRGLPPPAGPPVRLVATRVARCERTFERKGAEITTLYACLDPGTTTVAVVLRETTPGVLMGRPRLSGHLPLQGVRLVDDLGTSSVTAFSGGGSPAAYRGQLTTNQPLSPRTQWIEVDGERVDLLDAAPLPPIEVETLEDTSLAERYLWSRMAAGRHGPHGGPFPPQVDVAVETLVAAGALEPDDPVVDELQAVLGAFSGRALLRPVRQPWQSLLSSQHRQSSRSGVVPLGVVTPPLSGTTIAVDALVIAQGAVDIHVRTTPITGHLMPGRTVLGNPEVGWWAADELGNHYLGAPTSWSRGASAERGVIVLWPSLDDAARTLRLMPTIAGERAVITVPLPDDEVST